MDYLKSFCGLELVLEIKKCPWTTDANFKLTCSTFNYTLLELRMAASGGDLSWYFSQVKGTLDDDVAEGN